MSPSEAEVDFTQSQEPMIPPVICQGSKAITIHRSSGRFHSLQITTEFFSQSHTMMAQHSLDLATY